MKFNQSLDSKQKISNVLISWLPVLHSSLDELNKELKEMSDSNPFLELNSNFEDSLDSKFKSIDQNREKEDKKSLDENNFGESFDYNSRDNFRNSITINSEFEGNIIGSINLEDHLYEQIHSSIFPTPQGVSVAYKIVENLDENGFFVGDIDTIAQQCDVSSDMVSSIRRRFSLLEPIGVGAIDNIESFIFQLDSSDCSNEVYDLATIMINNLEELHKYKDSINFNEVIKLIKSFRTPPAIDFYNNSSDIVVDIFINIDEYKNIEVILNDSYYPVLNISKCEHNEQDIFVSKKLREARNLVDALEMRKSTLYKIGLMLVDHQYDFFLGGDMKPLILKNIADEFGYNPSTISRAIANKYISCNRGVLAMKDFFSVSVKDVSSSAIKEYIKQLIKNEDKNKPYSDIRLLELVEKNFEITLVRRTISKYRKILNIATSNDRKKLYLIGSH